MGSRTCGIGIGTSSTEKRPVSVRGDLVRWREEPLVSCQCVTEVYVDVGVCVDDDELRMRKLRPSASLIGRPLNVVSAFTANKLADRARRHARPSLSSYTKNTRKGRAREPGRHSTDVPE